MELLRGTAAHVSATNRVSGSGSANSVSISTTFITTFSIGDRQVRITVAATSGDASAMRELIEGFDAADLQRCWMWLHLAALYGVDLTKDDYHAINEDGSEYDDDIGGPMYAAGVGGIELPPLTPEADARALQAARDMFSRTRSSTLS